MSAEQSKAPRMVACPQCGAKSEWRTDNPYRPFCSERCKLIDLGAWAMEAYRVAGTETPMPNDPNAE